MARTLARGRGRATADPEAGKGLTRDPSGASGFGQDELELELVRSVAAGDRAALERLYREYQHRLARFLRRSTRRPDVIEEVINETFWIVWQKAAHFRGESRVSTWIFGIAWRVLLRVFRRHGDSAAEVAVDDFADYPAVDPSIDHELHDWLGKGLATLPVEQRVALELAYGAGHSVNEIADMMDCSVSAVKARMHHARAKLRKVLPRLAGTIASPAARIPDEIAIEGLETNQSDATRNAVSVRFRGAPVADALDDAPPKPASSPSTGHR